MDFQKSNMNGLFHPTITYVHACQQRWHCHDNMSSFWCSVCSNKVSGMFEETVHCLDLEHTVWLLHDRASDFCQKRVCRILSSILTIRKLSFDKHERSGVLWEYKEEVHFSSITLWAPSVNFMLVEVWWALIHDFQIIQNKCLLKYVWHNYMQKQLHYHPIKEENVLCISTCHQLPGHEC